MFQTLNVDIIMEIPEEDNRYFEKGDFFAKFKN